MRAKRRNANLVPSNGADGINVIELGSLAKEIGAASKGRWGAVTDITNDYAWVEMSDGDMFRKMKKNLMLTTEDDIDDGRFVEDAKVTVGTLIECIGGCNSGLKGRVLKITPCYYRFKAESLAFRTKPVMVSKIYAKAINDVFSKK